MSFSWTKEHCYQTLMYKTKEKLHVHFRWLTRIFCLQKPHFVPFLHPYYVGWPTPVEEQWPWHSCAPPVLCREDRTASVPFIWCVLPEKQHTLFQRRVDEWGQAPTQVPTFPHTSFIVLPSPSLWHPSLSKALVAHRKVERQASPGYRS